MTRQEFEALAREQNARRDREVAEARTTSTACETIDMLAFGTTYCRTHRVMGECPYGKAVQS